MATKIERAIAKRAQTQQIMRELGIPLWIVWVEDNEAEKNHLPLIGAPEGAARRAYVITPEQAISFCFHTEAKKQPEYGFRLVETDRDVLTPLTERLDNFVDLNSKTRIALNYSFDFGMIDTIGYGNYLNIRHALRQKYSLLNDGNFVSAEDIIISAASAKLPEEIKLLKEASELTDLVLNEAFTEIKFGMTEKEVASIVKLIASLRMREDPRISYSWAESMNPIVLTGEGIGGSPHAAPSNRFVQYGDTVYIDFGLSVEGYAGDLQHMGYVLRDGESSPPPLVLTMFELIKRSIDAGIRTAKPDVQGWEVDKASRDVIVDAGYPSYQHGTGHQLGCGATHTPGVAFTQRCTTEGSVVPEACLKLREGYTLTIEPRIQIPNGGSIEVDGVVTRDGFVPFVPIQKELHLIK